MPTLLLLLASTALGGDLVVQASVPTEIYVDGFPTVELYRAAEVRLEAEVGVHKLDIWRNGERERLEIQIPEDGSDVVVVVGRSGISSGRAAVSQEVSKEPVAVEFRTTANVDMMLVLGKDRHAVEPGKTLTLTLTPGDHPMTLRSADGTVIWAQGRLEVKGPLVVQLSDGRMPEIPGGNGRFRSER